MPKMNVTLVVKLTWLKCQLYSVVFDKPKSPYL
jgi:hypothetical protein